MFSSLIAILSIASAGTLPPPKTYKLVTIHSGTDYQYQPVELVHNGFFSTDKGVSEAVDAEIAISQDGTLYANGKPVELQNGILVASTEPQYSQVSAKIDDGHLSIDGSDSFYICTDTSSYIAHGTKPPASCGKPVGISLHAIRGN